MSASRAAAKEDILTLINTVVVSEGLHAVWENTDNEYIDQKPSTLIPWVRVLVRHRAGNARSLSSSTGTRKHDQTGFALVEIMTPLGGGITEADSLSSAFTTAFRTRSSYNQEVWYTNVMAQEVGQDDGWYKTNVVAEFHYDIIE